jgi:hypothetical protein
MFRTLRNIYITFRKFHKGQLKYPLSPFLNSRYKRSCQRYRTEPEREREDKELTGSLHQDPLGVSKLRFDLPSGEGRKFRNLGFESPKAIAIQRASVGGGGGASSPTVLFFAMPRHGFRLGRKKPRRAHHFAVQSIVGYTLHGSFFRYLFLK